jgi:hypothetical protein
VELKGSGAPELWTPGQQIDAPPATEPLEAELRATLSHDLITASMNAGGELSVLLASAVQVLERDNRIIANLTADLDAHRAHNRELQAGVDRRDGSLRNQQEQIETGLEVRRQAAEHIDALQAEALEARQQLAQEVDRSAKVAADELSRRITAWAESESITVSLETRLAMGKLREVLADWLDVDPDSVYAEDLRVLAEWLAASPEASHFIKFTKEADGGYLIESAQQTFDPAETIMKRCPDCDLVWSGKTPPAVVTITRLAELLGRWLKICPPEAGFVEDDLSLATETRLTLHAFKARGPVPGSPVPLMGDPDSAYHEDGTLKASRPPFDAEGRIYVADRDEDRAVTEAALLEDVRQNADELHAALDELDGAAEAAAALEAADELTDTVAAGEEEPRE